MKIIKKNILDAIDHLCTRFLYYDRDFDENLTREQLNKAVEDKKITIKEMVDKFEECLNNNFK